MAINPTGTETLPAPGQGVLFYKALECFDDFTWRLIENYSQAVMESGAAKGLADSQPFFHGEYKELDDDQVSDLYAQRRVLSEAGNNDEHERLHQEMAWRYRLREEAARAADIASAIKKDIFGGQQVRTFVPSEPVKNLSNHFVDSLIGMCGEQLHGIGSNRYGKLTLATIHGGEQTYFARFDESVTVFGITAVLYKNDLQYVREANADDCCKLVADLQRVASEENTL